jgi:hypothetical protein
MPTPASPFTPAAGTAASVPSPPGGADVSWVAGFAVASLLYPAGAKRFACGEQVLPATAGPAGSAS